MLNNPIAILILSILFGITVKMADLLDEHGLKIFKGDALLFGILWGAIGSILILSNQIIATFFLAIILHWILRYRIDYLNHGVAACLMIITYIYSFGNFNTDWLLFLIIFIPYSFFGLFNDAADRGEIKGKIAKFFQLNSHLIIFPLILIFINQSYWIVLASSFLQIIFYNFTAKLGMKIISLRKIQ